MIVPLKRTSDIDLSSTTTVFQTGGKVSQNGRSCRYRGHTILISTPRCKEPHRIQNGPMELHVMYGIGLMITTFLVTGILPDATKALPIEAEPQHEALSPKFVDIVRKQRRKPSANIRLHANILMIIP